MVKTTLFKRKSMDFLPKDPAILVSSTNMLLRDEEFDTQESLCYAFSREPKQIKDYLYKRGFVWNKRFQKDITIAVGKLERILLNI